MADVILAGGLPYRDAWEVKGPLAYYLVALGNLAFGRNYWGIRLFDLLIIGVGTLPMYRFLRHFIPASFSLAGVGLFLLWYAALD
ncbi:MAG: hypothetical protein M3P24_08905, partial [Gemmatimonadota bacterium]|nr:hypothetical protein [Gemmatimonadota bacterium]